GAALKLGAVVLDRARLIARAHTLHEVAGLAAALGRLDPHRAQAWRGRYVRRQRLIVAEDTHLDRADAVHQPEAPAAGHLFQRRARLPAQPTRQPADIQQRLDALCGAGRARVLHHDVLDRVEQVLVGR